MIPRLEFIEERPFDEYPANKSSFRAVSPVQVTLKRAGSDDLVLGKGEVYEILRVLCNRGMIRMRATFHGQTAETLYQKDYEGVLHEVACIEAFPRHMFLLDNDDGFLAGGYEWDDTDCVCLSGPPDEIVWSCKQTGLKATAIRKPAKKKGGK